jgi:hypothetical protein
VTSSAGTVGCLDLAPWLGRRIDQVIIGGESGAKRQELDLDALRRWLPRRTPPAAPTCSIDRRARTRQCLENATASVTPRNLHRAAAPSRLVRTLLSYRA